MGDWSEAMEDGIICRGCAMPLGGVSEGGYCPECANRQQSEGRNKLGPRWLPDNGADRTPRKP